MSTQLFQQVNTKLVPEHRIIGNTEGVAIMEEVASLREALNNLLFPIRIAILDDWSNVYRPRNNVAHEGQVDADIRVIQFMSPIESERADAWKRAFQAVYGISYYFHEGILCAPNQLREVLDIHASVTVLHSWKLRSTSRSKSVKLKLKDKEFILQSCNVIRDAWIRNEANLFEEGSETRNLYNEIITCGHDL
jgi:hypothetical protein